MPQVNETSWMQINLKVAALAILMLVIMSKMFSKETKSMNNIDLATAKILI